MATGSILVLSRSYVFDPRPRFPFRMAAKRYWIGECPEAVSKNREDDLTLVFVSANGAHKEQWEPIIQRIFEHQQAPARRTIRFHDMWSLDLPNQGDSAVLNEEILRWGYDSFSGETCARGVHAFLTSIGTGVDIDFSKRKLVFVGHSLGSIVGVLLNTYYPFLKISSLHLFEPSFAGEKAQGICCRFAEIVGKRKDIWPSREDAFQELRAQPRIMWDERVLKIFIDHGLRPLPTAEYPELKEGVTPKCTNKQVAASFRDCVSWGVAYRYLPHVLKEIPTHITYGTVTELLSEELQEETIRVASGGISNFASVTRIPGAGHMIVQTHPDDVADILWKSLIQSHESSPVKNTMIAKL